MRYLGYFSVFICLLFLFINYINIFLNIKIKKKQLFYVLLLVLCAILIITICTNPYEGDDLSRYFIHIQNFREKGLNYLIDFPYKENIITIILFYMVSLSSNNNLLPFISTFSFYFVLILLLYKSIDDENWHSRNTSLLIIVLASFVYLNHIISSVRYPLAISIFIFILINDKQNNKLYSLLYLIPIFIHTSLIVPVGLVFISKLLIIDNPTIRKCISFSVFFLPYICLIAKDLVPSNIPIISDAFNRLGIYSNPSFYLQFIDWRVLVCNLSLFFSLIYLFIKNRKEFENKYNIQYVNYYYILMFFLLAMLPFPMIQQRFLDLLILLSFPLFNFISNMNFKEKRIFILFIIILCLGMFAYRMVNAIHYWRFY